MELGSPALTSLAADWRRTLFPDASNEAFADGYAQAVTFGLLMARAQGIVLSNGLDRAATLLRQTNLLIGTALRVLTDDVDNQATLETSLKTLTRVLDVVHWPTISKGNPEAWLYFYELFLSVYDNSLRKKTGSYYTPPEIVTAMVRFVDEALRDNRRFGVADGLASPDVTLADPAMGTGTFLLGVLQSHCRKNQGRSGRGRRPRGDPRGSREDHRLRDSVRPVRGRATAACRRGRRSAESRHGQCRTCRSAPVPD